MQPLIRLQNETISTTRYSKHTSDAKQFTVPQNEYAAVEGPAKQGLDSTKLRELPNSQAATASPGSADQRPNIGLIGRRRHSEQKLVAVFNHGDFFQPATVATAFKFGRKPDRENLVGELIA